MPTAIIFQHQAAHIHFSGPVDDTIAHGGGAALTASAADDPGRDILLRVQAVDQESVAGIDGIDAPQVGNRSEERRVGKECRL